MGFVIVFLGAGVVGAVRHGVNLMVAHLLGLGFPWATLSINIIGSLLMGMLTEVFVVRTGLPQELRLFLTTGILGGFTTFSTFSLDAVGLWERGEVSAAILYASASVILAFIVVFAGMALVRGMVGGQTA
ncbi:fluoride efflux transporter CrcB [Rhizobium skierniewicense]|uniref:fluoride efflux transporter CrcB n=1 Tax=Rhizobium/Agrobacterium group TaxID=227290 RepID=UPI000DE40013|nr:MULTISPECIES: fluoride efflux transporter CrcB [Rhizobium/Agrobacterium group]MCI9865229.1 fluoride efflux transporter CrcB [Rhizobium skierniewicense]NTF07693.1 fluoride efflux transporter CrcB [Agrobacterium rubi]NTF26908.1 fluoride efflux transporter CrcB [Agrobacterium rubi]UHS56398.1 fluoride efflux transporter CrcB [Agrobacterium vaccinii]